MILDTFFGRYDGAQLEAKSVRKSYSREYKVQAAEMVLDGGQSVPKSVQLWLGLRPFVVGLSKCAKSEPARFRLEPKRSRLSSNELKNSKRWFGKRIGISKSKKASAPASGLQRSFSLINELSEQYPVIDCCRVLGVKRSSFYAWRKRQGLENPDRDALRLRVIKHFNESRNASGSRTLVQELRREGHEVGRYKAR
jgi:putative transposase